MSNWRNDSQSARGTLDNEEPILVTGATGKTGRELVRCLSEGGYAVRALVHSRAKGEALERAGIDVAYGDFDEPESIATAMHGAGSLFLLSPIHARMAEREEETLKAAMGAGLRRVVLLSGRGATLDAPSAIVRMHARSERYLRDSNLEYTILRPDFLMQNMLGYGPTIRTKGFFTSTFADTPQCMVDCRDVAAAAMSALTEGGHGGKTYDLTGPEALSMVRAAQKLTAGLGRQVSCVEISQDQLRAGLKAMGAPEWLIDDLCSAKGPDGSLSPTSSVAELTDRQPYSFDQFVQAYSSVFLKDN